MLRIHASKYNHTVTVSRLVKLDLHFQVDLTYMVLLLDQIDSRTARQVVLVFRIS